MTVKRSLCLVAFFALMAGTVFGQETYSLPASAGNVTTLTSVINFQNGELCARLSLPRTCTQAQACVAPGCLAAGGASCSAAQARAAGCRVYPASTQAGREEFVTFFIAAPRFIELVAMQNAESKRAFCEAWTANSGGQASCRTAISAASGTDPCVP